MKQWQPLTDIWNNYHNSLEEASELGFLDTPEDAEGVVWPYQLMLGEEEKDDVRSFLNDRIIEIQNDVKANQGLNMNMLVAVIFRSVLSGMVWERERIGR